MKTIPFKNRIDVQKVFKTLLTGFVPCYIHCTCEFILALYATLFINESKVAPPEKPDEKLGRKYPWSAHLHSSSTNCLSSSLVTLKRARAKKCSRKIAGCEFIRHSSRDNLRKQAMKVGLSMLGYYVRVSPQRVGG